MAPQRELHHVLYKTIDIATHRIMLVSSTGMTEERIEEIRRLVPRDEIVVVADNAISILQSVHGVDALIGCPRPAFSKEVLTKAGGRLRWIHVPGAGCEEFLIPELIESSITLTNGRIVQGPEVADHAFALLLALTRNICYVLRGHVGAMPRPIELRRKTMLVFGLGGVGMLVAERGAAFGMKVIGINPDYVPMSHTLESVYPPERLLEMLPLADFVVVTAPVTEKTRSVFQREAFSVMKNSAYFINVSRGKVADTEALVQALRSRKLGGAGLDVTDPEPLPDDHPLRSMSNVVLTPHIAGPSDRNRERSFELIKNNILNFVRDLPLVNVVDKRLGY